MNRRELDAAGITGTALRSAYAECRRINAQHGRTYFLATRLLPARARPATHALYGFARSCDDLVDDPVATADPAAGLLRMERALDTVYDEGAPGPVAGDPVLAALTDTVRTYRLDRALFDAFLASMRMDTVVTEYRTFAELDTYVHGSARVIGLQMLPVLGTVARSDRSTVDFDGADPGAAARRTAGAAGEAFQLTNFLRDIGEDLDRGRLYLPTAELAVHGVDRELLLWSRRTGRPDRRIRQALAALVARTRAIYRRAWPGVALLRPESRACVSTALTLYEGILDEIAAADYAVLGHRVAVPNGRRLAVAGAGLIRSATRPAGGNRWRPVTSGSRARAVRHN
ncbi:phytoene synthase [Amycolatopsis antarctica]|uniref:Phytoene synthase n=1 Tax=Amycolatopsis antarctica TaxID=1854586 RepID=A0A263D7N5_9PSEU|nr:phytoene/squalene synthase family protein [Amycolatopsis antarctica]OZM74443.1 phytoene synthase [Amycolatopsis antarctica]